MNQHVSGGRGPHNVGSQDGEVEELVLFVVHNPGGGHDTRVGVEEKAVVMVTINDGVDHS